MFDGVGGVKLYGQWWRPHGDVHGVLVVQHGLNDHGDRYAGLAARLVTAGYAVYAMDLRGHGRSAGPRVDVNHFADYVDDFSTWVAHVRVKEPGKPVFVFGHSMGGLIATLYGEAHARDVAGVILSAPALGLDAPPLQVAGLVLAGYLGAPGNMLPQRDAEFSRDPATVAEMGRDPLLTHADGPTHTAVELAANISRAWANAADLSEPLLILHGTADRLTSPVASHDFVERVSATDKRQVLLPDAWHDITHDPQSDVVMADIVAWLDAHTAGGPGIAAGPGVALPAGRQPSATAVELGGVVGASNGMQSSGLLRSSLSFGRAIGYHAELELRVRDGVGLALLPVGVATRIGRAGEVAVSAGASAGWPGGWSVVELPAQISLELPFGPTHLLARASAGWIVHGTRPMTRALGVADELGATLAIRLGRDRAYWSQVSAGSGPFVGATWSRSSTIDQWGVVFGLHLWGVN
ncbi:MAG TPA: alpha/beta hydrolase [Kofleriaceae bacterium]|nr:alpha/beta hydrolase [Kofleriaceae bacterium]